jgi:hypothetical protein
MLLCNNTAIAALWVINRAGVSAKAGRAPLQHPIIAAMDDADELARRYFALWGEYLTALVADPQAAELLQRLIAFTGQFAGHLPGASDAPAGFAFPAWPPTPAADGSPGRPQAVAAPAPGSPGERDDAVGELARRVGELERRLAAVERRPQTQRPRRRSRASGK